MNKALESYLYISYETVAGLNLLAQIAAEMEKDYHNQTENAVSVNATLIKKSQSINSMDGDNSTDRLSIPHVLASIEVVRKSSRFFSKFDWSRCEWLPLNKKKTMYTLVLKGKAGVAWL